MKLGVRSRRIREIQPGDLLAVAGDRAEIVVVTKYQVALAPTDS